MNIRIPTLFACCIAFFSQPSVGLRAEGYAFSNLSIDKFATFWQSSIADASNLNQGPTRDGTGAQVDVSDLASNTLVLFAAGTKTVLEGAIAAGGSNPDSPQNCFGTCLSGQNDFSLPPLFPASPTSNIKFARSDQRHSGSIFTTSHIGGVVKIDLVGELELNASANGKPASGRASSEFTRIFRIKSAGQMVFDFDATAYMRSLNQLDIPVGIFDSSTSFRISIVDGVGNQVFDFAPNGTAGGYVGATVIADPFSLNSHLIVEPPYSLTDTDYFHSGQFRVITPQLLPGISYHLDIEAVSMAEAVNVPEPSAVSIGVFAAMLLLLRPRGV
jgi:hypothetical protein